MKESSGELSMTVITIVAVIAIGGIVSAFALPTVRNWIQSTFNSIGASQVCVQYDQEGKCLKWSENSGK